MTSVAFCGCPSAHIGRMWLSVCVCVCLWLSASTHKTPVCVHQHTQDVYVCLSAHTGRPSLSISTHISTLILGLSTLALPVDGSGDFAHVGCLFSTHRTAVGVHQHTQDIRGCLSVHTGHSWLSVCVRVCPCVSVRTHMTSVAVHQHTYQHVGRWTQHANPSRGLFG